MRNAAYVLFISFSAGIAVSSLWPRNFSTIVCLSALLLIVAICLAVFLSKSKRTIVISAAVALICFAGGVWRNHSVEFQPARHEFDATVGKKVLVRGLVIKEPDMRDAETMLTLKALNGVTPHQSVNILLMAAPGPPYAYGDIITAQGKLALSKNFETDASTTFDYVDYLAKDGIFYEMKMPAIKIVAQGQGNILIGKLLAIKNFFVGKDDAVIPFPESALLGGILFGSKRSLGTKLLAAFQTSGVIHMVVISGYNISIVGNAAAAILSVFPRIVALVGGATSIALFVAMTGFGGSSIRAAIMAFIAISGQVFRRNYDPLRALFLSGFVMIAWNPLTLLYDPSFQLSFIATLGIIILPSKFEKFLRFLPETFGFREIVAATLSSQIMLLPLLLYMDGAFSMYALPVNMLVLFPVPLTMLLGFLTGLAGIAGIYISIPFAFFSFLLLSYELNTVIWFSKMPLASIHVTFPLWAMIFVYTVYIVIYFTIIKKTPG
jgi:competence protein ComEC